MQIMATAAWFCASAQWRVHFAAAQAVEIGSEHMLLPLLAAWAVTTCRIAALPRLANLQKPSVLLAMVHATE